MWPGNSCVYIVTSKVFWEANGGIKGGAKQSGLMFSGISVAKAFQFMYVRASKQICKGEFTKVNFGLERWISLSCPIVRKKRGRDTGSFRERLRRAPSGRVFLSSDPTEPSAVG